MATYKDYLGSSSYYDELVKRLKNGEASLKTSETKSGSISQDEYGQYVWFPDGGGFPQAIPASDLNKYYNPETGQYRLTKQVAVSPYIDLGNKPIAGMDQWPVQDLGNGNYQLSVMNSGEGGYSNVVFNADSSGKPILSESAPAFFQPYNSGNFFSDITGEALNLATSDAGKMLALAAGAGVFSPAAAGGAGALTGTDAALADLAASSPAFAPEAAAAGGLMTGGSTGTGFKAAGTTGLTGAGTTAYGGLGAGLGEATAAGGIGGSAIGGLGLTGGEAAFGGLGADLGTAGLAAGTGSLLGTGAAAGGVAAGLTAAEAAKAGLISGGLNTVGGLLQGETSKDAANQLAAQQAALAEKTLQMGKFQPVGVTTRFGTSAFTTDPVTGAVTPSYTLSPEAKAYQDALAGMGTQALTAGQGIMNLGQQYVGESPEAVRNRYIQTQQALLAPQQEQTLAALRNRQAATGRGGLAFGATSPEAGGLMATNPEIAAYYNSLAQTQRQLAANAETQYQNQVNFGTGLLGSATTPFTNVFGAQKGVELAAQQPLELSTNFANTVATRGAAQGANYATAMAPSLQAQYNANNYNPLATGLQGAASNPLTGYGLMKLTGLA